MAPFGQEVATPMLYDIEMLTYDKIVNIWVFFGV